MNPFQQWLYCIKATFHYFTWNPMLWLTDRNQCYSLSEAWDMAEWSLAYALTYLEMEKDGTTDEHDRLDGMPGRCNGR